jgi:tripartite-type tricarboxylate transporter receptor subunit TctC
MHSYRRLCRCLPVMLTIIAGSAHCQTYPARAVRVVVPYPAGGSVDVVARLLSQKFNEAWKQPIVIDNRPGAGGNIGADLVAKAAADGYTLLLTTAGFAISPSIYRKLPFDAVKDFAALSQISNTYHILIVNPSVPVHSVKELISMAKAQPGKLNYASTGSGGSLHLAGELFKLVTGTDIVHVPYKGNAPAFAALLAGEVQVAFVPLFGILPQISAGKLRPLAITHHTRSGAMPQVPTMAEAGVHNFASAGWLGMFAPEGTPPAILDVVQKQIVRIISTPENKQQLPVMGNEPVGSTPPEFEKKYRADIADFADLVKKAGIQPAD